MAMAVSIESYALGRAARPSHGPGAAAAKKAAIGTVAVDRDNVTATINHSRLFHTWTAEGGSVPVERPLPVVDDAPDA